MNINSIASLWMTINQLQLFFLLLLTGAYIPTDIKAIINASDFASNIYKFIPLNSNLIYPKLIRSFEFGLTNSTLNSVGINDDSTIINLYTFFIFTGLMIIFEMFIILLRLLIDKLIEKGICLCVLKFCRYIIDKIFKFMTLGCFIRSTLEISQFVLISSINEIYLHNTKDYHR